MATSSSTVNLPANVWVDLYVVTGIAVGTQIVIQNIGFNDVRLSEASSEPTLSVGYNKAKPNDFVTSAVTPVGAWARAHQASKLQVESI